METTIQKLNTSELAKSFACTFGFIFLVCALIWYVFGASSIAKIFNILFHGIDFQNIMRTDIPILESVIGFVCFTLSGWLVGFLVGFFYNRSK